VPETTLSDLSTAELAAAADAISGGDETAGRFARDIRRLVDNVNSESRKAAGEHARLHSDDLMNVDGKARLLAELPAKLINATSEQLREAEFGLEVIESIHLTSILHHDARNDGALRAELGNYVASLEQKNAVERMLQLASSARYATLLAGPMGDSLAARFNFDAGILRKVALEALASPEVGSDDQVRRSAALAAIKNMKRAIGLAKGGRDLVAEEVKRPPRAAQPELYR